MKRVSTWDPSILLAFLDRMSIDSLKNLTLKLVALFMLLSSSRAHCVHKFSMEPGFMDMREDRVTFYPTKLLKHSRPRFRGTPITYRKYTPHENLCVVSTAKLYLSRTVDLRHTTDFFVTHRRPHNPASRDTVARWLREVLCMAGITGFSAHSYRAASTSMAKTINISIKDIMSQGQWTQESTFTRFYQKEIIFCPKPVGHSLLDSYLNIDTS